MAKKDLSMIALVFFLSRCFFNLYTFTNLYQFLFCAFIIFVMILIMKKINIDLAKHTILKWVYILSLLPIFVLILYNASNFININYFRYHNYFTTTLSILTISYIIGRDKIKTISSISEVFLFIFIVIALLISISLLSLIKVENYNGFLTFSRFSIRLLPFLLLMPLFYIRKNNITLGYLFGSFSALFDLFLLIGSLGTKLPHTYTYPGISILKTITFFNFVNHLDKLFSFIYLFEYTITLALILNIILNLVKKDSPNEVESKKNSYHIKSTQS